MAQDEQGGHAAYAEQQGDGRQRDQRPFQASASVPPGRIPLCSGK